MRGERSTPLRRAWLIFSDPWRLVPFQPILFTMVWIATIVIHFTPNIDVRTGFMHLYGPWAHTGWMILALGSPPLALLAWVLIKFSGLRYAGFWLRLGGDVGVFCTLLAFFFARADVAGFATDDFRLEGTFERAAILVFTFLLVARDIAKLVITEHTAFHIRRASNRKGAPTPAANE